MAPVVRTSSTRRTRRPDTDAPGRRGERAVHVRDAGGAGERRLPLGRPRSHEEVGGDVRAELAGDAPGHGLGLVVAPLQEAEAREGDRHHDVWAPGAVGAEGAGEEAAERGAEAGLPAVLQRVLDPLDRPARVERPERDDAPDRGLAQERPRRAGLGAREPAEARRAQRGRLARRQPPLAADAEGGIEEAREPRPEVAQDGEGGVGHRDGARHGRGGPGNILAAPSPYNPDSMPERRGMIIKNVSEDPIDLKLQGRTVHLDAGEEKVVSAVEVRDAVLREALQVRRLAIVRPSTDEEAAELDRA